jgi:hypothetical protein
MTAPAHGVALLLSLVRMLLLGWVFLIPFLVAVVLLLRRVVVAIIIHLLRLLIVRVALLTVVLLLVGLLHLAE